MLLRSKDLVEAKTVDLLSERSALEVRPGLALVWVGEDSATGTFVRAKQQKAKKLDCNFFLHHLEQATYDQLAAMIQGLNRKKDIHGIVLQLPLPIKEHTEDLIGLLSPDKDIDNLRGDSSFASPTPSGIIELLQYNKINLETKKTIIIGGGRLVGGPLAAMFQQNQWPFVHITNSAQSRIEEIRGGDILISATGLPGIVSPAMVHSGMVVVDGSGVDVDVAEIELLVSAVTPLRGAVGPMTVCYLFDNLFEAVRRQS